MPLDKAADGDKPPPPPPALGAVNAGAIPPPTTGAVPTNLLATGDPATVISTRRVSFAPANPIDSAMFPPIPLGSMEASMGDEPSNKRASPGPEDGEQGLASPAKQPKVPPHPDT